MVALVLVLVLVPVPVPALVLALIALWTALTVAAELLATLLVGEGEGSWPPTVSCP